jgi:GTP:adenosylcobinamide-phosphate guanylyltransferase
MTEHPTPTILVLAGKRDGKLDPLAEQAGVSHKAVVPIMGKPLIGHVLATLEKTWDDAKILVSIHDPTVLDAVEEVQRLKASGRLEMIPAEAGIVESVEAGAAKGGFPLLITTGDNVLTTAEALRAVNDAGWDREADAVLGLARREDIQAAHPEGQKKFYEFKDIAIANCNIYWLRDQKSLQAAEAFRGGGQFIKTPGAIRKAFGLRNLIRFRLRMDSLAGAMRRMSKRFGVRVIAHVLPDGRLAIDVDNQRTYDVTEELLQRDAAASA